MSKKLIDIAKLFSGQINSNELSAALSASDPFSVEFDDDAFNKMENQIKSMLTLDSAVNNPDVAKAMKPKMMSELGSELRSEAKKSIYDTIEKKFTGLGTKIGVELAGKNIDEQLDLIANAKVKSEPSKTNDDYAKLQQEFANFKTQAEQDKKDSDTRFTDFKINSKLQERMSSIPIAKAYQDPIIKSSLMDGVIKQVRSKAVIKLDDSTGDVKLFNPSNPEMELYGENNQKLGIDDIINPLMQPYLQATPDKPKTPPGGKEIKLSDLPDGANVGSAAAQVRNAGDQGVKY